MSCWCVTYDGRYFLMGHGGYSPSSGSGRLTRVSLTGKTWVTALPPGMENPNEIHTDGTSYFLTFFYGDAPGKICAATANNYSVSQVDYTSWVSVNADIGPNGSTPTQFMLVMALAAGVSFDLRNGPSPASMNSLISPPSQTPGLLVDPNGTPLVLWTFTWWQLPGWYFRINVSGGWYAIQRLMRWNS